jgi:hypothetical protein
MLTRQIDAIQTVIILVNTLIIYLEKGLNHVYAVPLSVTSVLYRQTETMYSIEYFFYDMKCLGGQGTLIVAFSGPYNPQLIH